MSTERSIQEVARLAGTTSRTLRHYDDVGLLHPSRIGSNGYRYYDADALVRLQRILLLRDLGLGLPQIARALESQPDEVRALRTHAAWLRAEQERIARQIATVERTVRTIEEGTEPMAEQMFDGFDHTQHRAEVEQRWGKDAYARSDAWWRELSDDERAAWQQRTADRVAAWRDAAERGVDPTSAEAQELAREHVAWLASVPGTPRTPDGTGAPDAYVVGLAEMYVADPRFAATYGGQDGATFVRDVLVAFVEGRGSGR
ncbi:MAG TPA: MerR family transcriptional regulator [Luteimicrobium sp.]|nr:MerR family transcriptional regulator [Luteimicrobium sp.]